MSRSWYVFQLFVGRRIHVFIQDLCLNYRLYNNAEFSTEIHYALSPDDFVGLFSLGCKFRGLLV